MHVEPGLHLTFTRSMNAFVASLQTTASMSMRPPHTELGPLNPQRDGDAKMVRVIFPFTK